MVEEKITEKPSKVKKKKWIKIIAPKSFNNEIAGEIPVNEPKSLVGKKISVNLMTLTHDMKKQNTNLKLIITNVQSDKANTELYGYNLSASSVRRLVRKGKERLDMSFTCKTSDNKNVRVKPLMVPSIKVKGSVSASLRRITKTYFINIISKMTFDNVIKDLISNKLHKTWKDELKKTYPIRIVEVAAFTIEREGKIKKEGILPLKEEKAEDEEQEEKKREEPIQGKVEEAIKQDFEEQKNQKFFLSQTPFEKQKIQNFPTSKSKDFEEQKIQNIE